MKHRAGAALLSAFGVAAAVAIAATVGAPSGDKPSIRTEIGVAAVPAQSGLTDLGESPFSIVPQTVVALDKEVVALGTDQVGGSINAVVSYDPQSGIWRQLPAPPSDVALLAQSGVWNGHDLVVLGVQCDPASMGEDDAPCAPGTPWAGTYEPTEAKWTSMPPPVPRLEHGEDGTFAVPVGRLGSASIFEIDKVLWSFDNGEWTDLPPLSETQTFACVAGESLISGGAITEVPDNVGASNRVNIVGAALYRLSDDRSTWAPLPTLDIRQEFPNTYSFTCSDSSVLATTWLMNAGYSFGFDSNAWSEVSAIPPGLADEPFANGQARPSDMPTQTSAMNSAWTGSSFVWWNPARSFNVPRDGEQIPVTFPGNGFVFEPAANQWRKSVAGPAVFGSAEAKRIAWLGGVGYAFKAAEKAPHFFVYAP